MWQKTDLSQWEKDFQTALAQYQNTHEKEVLAPYLGKNSPLKQALKSLKDLSPEQRQQWGGLLQEKFASWNQQFADTQAQVQAEQEAKQLEADWFDVTATPWPSTGSIHPLNQLQERIENIFMNLGYSVWDGPEVETEWFNFDALNIPSTHPARDMQDTFWVKSSAENPLVLRTHTSNVQVRSMLEHGAPLRGIIPGRVYRNEAIDSTHDATFYQVEGLLIDKGVNLTHLKGTINTVLSEVFGRPIKTRFRPGYFPFVEPGLEVDIWFEYRDKHQQLVGKWLEFMGAGMVHPKVLKAGKIDPEKYMGFAFGFGLTRLVMIQYGLNDIRHLFSNRPEFLASFYGA